MHQRHAYDSATAATQGAASQKPPSATWHNRRLIETFNQSGARSAMPLPGRRLRVSGVHEVGNTVFQPLMARLIGFAYESGCQKSASFLRSQAPARPKASLRQGSRCACP